MNVSVRRHGLVVQTVRITGDSARIGSAEECEVRLADPAIAPVVGEFVGRHGIWRIIDNGTDASGVKKYGVRISDEILEPGITYVIGAFELMTDANPARKITQATSILGEGEDLELLPTMVGGVDGDTDEVESFPVTMVRPERNTDEVDSFPMTMIQADLRDTPATVIQDFEEIRTPRKPRPSVVEPAPGKLVFHKQEQQAEPPAPKTRPRSKRDLATFAGLAAVVIVLTVIGIRFAMVPGAPPQTSTVSAAPPAPSVASLVADGDRYARELQLDQAFASWEAAAQKSPDAALRARISSGAFDIARAYAAAKDGANAKKYFAKVVKYGDPNAPEVAYAKSYIAR